MSATASPHLPRGARVRQTQGTSGALASTGSQVVYSCVVVGGSRRAKRLPSNW